MNGYVRRLGLEMFNYQVVSFCNIAFQLEDRLFEVQQHEQTLKQENVKLVQVYFEATCFSMSIKFSVYLFPAMLVVSGVSLGLLLQRNKSPPTWWLDFQNSVDICRYINGAMFLYILISQIERLAFSNGGGL